MFLKVLDTKVRITPSNALKHPFTATKPPSELTAINWDRLQLITFVDDASFTLKLLT